MLKRFACAAAAALIAAPALAQEPERAITKIEGNLYRFQDNEHYGVFLVTGEGIVVADPLNQDAAQWLKGELDARFDVPVRYVLYSHHHADHASGAAVFDQAQVVAHEAAAEALTPPPEGTEAYDQFQGQFGPDSFYGGVRAPDITYSGDMHTLSLGGQLVQMIHVGGNHAADMSVIGFPDQDAVFVVDIVNGRRLPFRNMPGFSMADTARLVDEILAQDFTHFAPGHGQMGGPEDVRDFLRYHYDLLQGVQEGIDAGHSLDQIKADVTLDAYSDWGAYEDWRALNIEGAYRYLAGR